MDLQTIYPFRLPRGYVDADGNLHREGQMRLATAGDELTAMRDPRVKANEGYMSILVLSRVVTSLGTLRQITPEMMAGLFIADMEYLQGMYETINKIESPQIQVTCPHCGTQFVDTINFLGAE